jgi:hypothetical protein
VFDEQRDMDGGLLRQVIEGGFDLMRQIGV